MTAVRIKIEGRTYSVDDQEAAYAGAVRLEDGPLYRIGSHLTSIPMMLGMIAPTKAEEIWEGIPILEKLDEEQRGGLWFLLTHEGQTYKAHNRPSRFARTPDTGKVLHIRWASDPLHMYVGAETTEVSDPHQLIKLLPLAELAF